MPQPNSSARSAFLSRMRRSWRWMVNGSLRSSMGATALRRVGGMLLPLGDRSFRSRRLGQDGGRVVLFAGAGGDLRRRGGGGGRRGDTRVHGLLDLFAFVFERFDDAAHHRIGVAAEGALELPDGPAELLVGFDGLAERIGVLAQLADGFSDLLGG